MSDDKFKNKCSCYIKGYQEGFNTATKPPILDNREAHVKQIMHELEQQIESVCCMCRYRENCSDGYTYDHKECLLNRLNFNDRR
jgi:hypothetical protein